METQRALQSPDVRERITSTANEPWPTSAAEFRAYVSSEIENGSNWAVLSTLLVHMHIQWKRSNSFLPGSPGGRCIGKGSTGFGGQNSSPVHRNETSMDKSWE